MAVPSLFASGHCCWRRVGHMSTLRPPPPVDLRPQHLANPFVFFFVCAGPKQEPEEMECIFLSATTGFTKGFIEYHDTLRFRGFLSIKAIDRERWRSLRLAASGGG